MKAKFKRQIKEQKVEVADREQVLQKLLGSELDRQALCEEIEEFLADEEEIVKQAKMSLMDKAIYLCAFEIYKTKVNKLIDHLFDYGIIGNEEEE